MFVKHPPLAVSGSAATPTNRGLPMADVLTTICIWDFDRPPSRQNFMREKRRGIKMACRSDCDILRARRHAGRRAGNRAFPLARRPAHDARRLPVPAGGRRAPSDYCRVARLFRHVRAELRQSDRICLGLPVSQPRLGRSAGRQFWPAPARRDVLDHRLRPQHLPQPAERCLRRSRLAASAGLRARRPHRSVRLVAGWWRGADVDRGAERRPSARPDAARFPRRGCVLPGLVPHRSGAGGMDDTDSAAGIAG